MLFSISQQWQAFQLDDIMQAKAATSHKAQLKSIPRQSLSLASTKLAGIRHKSRPEYTQLLEDDTSASQVSV
jgi:hypothetical protein